MQKQIVYSERAPWPKLSSWVQSLWTFDAQKLDTASYEHYIPPDGCISLVCQASPSSSSTSSMLILVGPRWQPHVVMIEQGDVYLGLRFWPYAARCVAGSALDRMVGHVRPLRTFPSEIASVLEPLEAMTADDHDAWQDQIQSALSQSFLTLNEVDPLVRSAVHRIIESQGQLRMRDLAQQLQISLRHLQRQFVQETGLTPKQFARIRRFRAAAAELLRESPRPWCHVAVDAGYADQAHLTREFTQLIGLSAKELETKYQAIFHDSVLP